MAWLWTPPEIEFLRERVDARDSAAAIADAMSRSRAGVEHQIKKLKLRNADNQPINPRNQRRVKKPASKPRTDLWTDDLKERARVMWEVDGFSGREIGTAIGRSRSAVLRMANKSGWVQRKADKVNHNLAVNAGRRDRPKLKRKPPSNVLKFEGVRMSPDITPPVALPPVEPSAAHAVGLVARGSRQCCYPVGEAGGADQLYCGAEKAGFEHDYCAWHRRIMFRKAA